MANPPDTGKALKKLENHPNHKNKTTAELQELAIELTTPEIVRRRFNHLLEEAQNVLFNIAEENDDDLLHTMEIEAQHQRVKQEALRATDLPIKLSLQKLRNAPTIPGMHSFAELLKFEFGPLHSAVVVGNILIEWGREGIVEPLPHGHFVPEFQASVASLGVWADKQRAMQAEISLANRQGNTEKIVDTLCVSLAKKSAMIDKLVDVIVDYNRNKKYRLFKCNCQDFARDALAALGIKKPVEFTGKLQQRFKQFQKGKIQQEADLKTHENLDAYIDLEKDNLTRHDLEYLQCLYFNFHLPKIEISPNPDAWVCDIPTCKSAELDVLIRERRLAALTSPPRENNELRRPRQPSQSSPPKNHPAPQHNTSVPTTHSPPATASTRERYQQTQIGPSQLNPPLGHPAPQSTLVAQPCINNCGEMGDVDKAGLCVTCFDQAKHATEARERERQQAMIEPTLPIHVPREQPIDPPSSTGDNELRQQSQSSRPQLNPPGGHSGPQNPSVPTRWSPTASTQRNFTGGSNELTHKTQTGPSQLNPPQGHPTPQSSPIVQPCINNCGFVGDVDKAGLCVTCYNWVRFATEVQEKEREQATIRPTLPIYVPREQPTDLPSSTGDSNELRQQSPPTFSHFSAAPQNRESTTPPSSTRRSSTGESNKSRQQIHVGSSQLSPTVGPQSTPNLQPCINNCGEMGDVDKAGLCVTCFDLAKHATEARERERQQATIGPTLPIHVPREQPIDPPSSTGDSNQQRQSSPPRLNPPGGYFGPLNPSVPTKWSPPASTQRNSRFAAKVQEKEREQTIRPTLPIYVPQERPIDLPSSTGDSNELRQRPPTGSSQLNAAPQNRENTSAPSRWSPPSNARKSSTGEGNKLRQQSQTRLNPPLGPQNTPNLQPCINHCGEMGDVDKAGLCVTCFDLARHATEARERERQQATIGPTLPIYIPREQPSDPSSSTGDSNESRQQRQSSPPRLNPPKGQFGSQNPSVPVRWSPPASTQRNTTGESNILRQTQRGPFQGHPTPQSTPPHLQPCINNCGSMGSIDKAGLCATCYNQARETTEAQERKKGQATVRYQELVHSQAPEEKRAKCPTPGCEFYGTTVTNFYCSKCSQLQAPPVPQKADLPFVVQEELPIPGSHLSSAPQANLSCPQSVRSSEAPKCGECQDYFASPEYGVLCHSCFMKKTKVESAHPAEPQIVERHFQNSSASEQFTDTPKCFECNTYFANEEYNGLCNGCFMHKTTLDTSQVKNHSEHKESAPSPPNPVRRSNTLDYHSQTKPSGRPYMPGYEQCRTQGCPHPRTETGYCDICNTSHMPPLKAVSSGQTECFLCTGRKPTDSNLVCAMHTELMQSHKMTGSSPQHQRRWTAESQYRPISQQDNYTPPNERPQRCRADTEKQSTPLNHHSQHLYRAHAGGQIPSSDPIVPKQTFQPYRARGNDHTVTSLLPQTNHPTSEVRYSQQDRWRNSSNGELSNKVCVTPGCSYMSYPQLGDLCPLCYKDFNPGKNVSDNLPLIQK